MDPNIYGSYRKHGVRRKARPPWIKKRRRGGILPLREEGPGRKKSDIDEMKKCAGKKRRRNWRGSEGGTGRSGRICETGLQKGLKPDETNSGEERGVLGKKEEL